MFCMSLSQQNWFSLEKLDYYMPYDRSMKRKGGQSQHKYHDLSYIWNVLKINAGLASSLVS